MHDCQTSDRLAVRLSAVLGGVLCLELDKHSLPIEIPSFDLSQSQGPHLVDMLDANLAVH